MKITKEELKKRACEAIDKNRDKIIALGDSIFMEPELGYKEVKTAGKIKKVFDELGLDYEDGAAVTGVIAPLKGKESKLKVSIMGELDAVIVPGHPMADKQTGAAHACGHNCMIASLAGVAYGLAGTGIMEELSGDISLMAVPSEEYVEIEYRNSLREEGKIHFLGGKQEFIRLGKMDDVDIMIMQHSGLYEGDGVKVNVSSDSNGFVGKMVRYIGTEAHAGASPHLGVNALNAANIGLMAVQMQRETFKDQDHIRVHPIITKGGDLVNVVPADVRIETYIRGANIDAILDADMKVTRAFKAGGDAVGAQTVFVDLPGYMPFNKCTALMDVAYENTKTLYGEEKTVYESEASGASTDAGDISSLMPTCHMFFRAISGAMHSASFEIADKEVAYIDSAKCLAMTAIDLLYDGAEKGLEIKESFKPAMTKAEYLKVWGRLDN